MAVAHYKLYLDGALLGLQGAGVTNSWRTSIVNFTGTTTQKERRAGKLIGEGGQR